MRLRSLLPLGVVIAGCAGNNHKVIRDTFVKELGCPAEKVVVMNFPKDDWRRGDKWQVYGCEQRRVCFDDDGHGAWVCRPADDFYAIAMTIKEQTNCPVETMKSLAYQETRREPTPGDDGSDWDWRGGTYRIEACDQHFVCRVAPGQPLSCDAAPDVAPQPPGSPQPVPPSR